METQSPQNPSLVYLVDLWRLDLMRFKREVATAVGLGMGDDLTLAEMECTLDLIEGDLLAMRAKHHPDSQATESLARAEAFHSELLALIDQMRPYCPRE